MTDDTREQTQDQATEEADVEGHMHPATARAIGAARQEELLARAAQDRLASSATGKGRDGGMLDKIRRFARRED